MNIPLAIIGGSGAYHILQTGGLGKEMECQTAETPFGKSNPIHRFLNGEIEFLFLSRHGEKDYSLSAPFVNYRANIYALKGFGVERIVAWSGPGIINRMYHPGEFSIPEDIIDETHNRESTFFKNRGYGFIRHKEPFCPNIRLALEEAVYFVGLPYREGAIYVCTEGPRLETPAEIRKLRFIGGDLVGMTLAPEAFLARELEMCYTPICYLVNYAEGIVQRKFKKGVLFEGMQSDKEKSTVQDAIAQFPKILHNCFIRLREKNRTCDCGSSMLRYKKKGMIKDDWKTWLGDL